MPHQDTEIKHQSCPITCALRSPHAVSSDGAPGARRGRVALMNDSPSTPVTRSVASASRARDPAPAHATTSSTIVRSRVSTLHGLPSRSVYCASRSQPKELGAPCPAMAHGAGTMGTAGTAAYNLHACCTCMCSPRRGHRGHRCLQSRPPHGSPPLQKCSPLLHVCVCVHRGVRTGHQACPADRAQALLPPRGVRVPSTALEALPPRGVRVPSTALDASGP